LGLEAGSAARRPASTLKISIRREDPMPPAPRIFAPAALADARYRYEETSETIVSIAARLGISERMLRYNIHVWGWRQRRPAAAAAANAAAARAAVTPAVVLSALELEAVQTAQTIQSTVQREVAVIGLIVAKLGASTTSAEAERTARTLATLTRTLQEVLRLTAPQAPSDEPANDRGPDDPDDFARDLVRRMDEFARRRQASLRDEPAAGIS
jgi:hypothetical protein